MRHLKWLGLISKDLAPEAIAHNWHTLDLVGTSLNHFEDPQIESARLIFGSTPGRSRHFLKCEHLVILNVQ